MARRRGVGACGILSLPVIFMGAVVGLGAAVNAVGSQIDYSEGDRIGHVDKLSYKGIFWKTHEGEMSMRGFRSNGDGGLTNMFEFSVRAERQDIIDQINAAQENGACVKLDYQQTLGSLPWQQGTSYRIVNVTELEQTACGRAGGPALTQ